MKAKELTIETPIYRVAANKIYKYEIDFICNAGDSVCIITKLKNGDPVYLYMKKDSEQIKQDGKTYFLNFIDAYLKVMDNRDAELKAAQKKMIEAEKEYNDLYKKYNSGSKIKLYELCEEE